MLMMEEILVVVSLIILRKVFFFSFIRSQFVCVSIPTANTPLCVPIIDQKLYRTTDFLQIPRNNSLSYTHTHTHSHTVTHTFTINSDRKLCPPTRSPTVLPDSVKPQSLFFFSLLSFSSLFFFLCCCKRLRGAAALWCVSDSRAQIKKINR